MKGNCTLTFGQNGAKLNTALYFTPASRYCFFWIEIIQPFLNLEGDIKFVLENYSWIGENELVNWCHEQDTWHLKRTCFSYPKMLIASSHASPFIHQYNQTNKKNLIDFRRISPGQFLTSFLRWYLNFFLMIKNLFLSLLDNFNWPIYIRIIVIPVSLRILVHVIQFEKIMSEQIITKKHKNLFW